MTSPSDPPADDPGEPADAVQQWPTHEVEDVWSGAAPFSVRRDTVSAPSQPDEQFGRLVLEHPGAVVVLALDEQDRVFVLRQYRHPVGRRLVELPAGLLDVPGEDPATTAERELREEALLEATDWTHLVSSYSSPGLSSEIIHYYLAQGLSAAADRGEGFELHHEEADMTSEWVPFEDLLAAFLDGRAADGPLGQALMACVLGGHRAAPTRPGSP